MENKSLDKLRHSAAHLLAAAVEKLYPEAKRTIGPSIESGFYYDFDNLDISESDLPKIEKEMRAVVENWDSFEKQELEASDAKEKYPGNPYKHELIDEFSKGGEEKVSFYKAGEFLDLCKGGHVDSPAKELKYFKLLKTAGAYWRGDEKNPMLTRIYGTAFFSQEDLDEYLQQVEEAKKRDHKVLGPKLELFNFHETAPGSPYWLPKGMETYNELIEFWRSEHKKRGYQEISSPLVNKKELWETSGHWEHYQDDMFIADMGENEVYGIKPMNCPNAMVVYGMKKRSYRDLPLRLSDTDTLHRYERSGTLNGLLRVRSFRQDDSHNFIREDQIEEEYESIFEITKLFYEVFDLPFRYRLGTRPEKFMGDPSSWDKAEKALKNILDKTVGEGNYDTEEGDGAFYGPKVDIVMKDALGRDWQMGTIQLDFQIPKRFDLKYSDKDGSEKMPVVVHRVIYGSIERFIAILVEHFEGALPLWISPVQLHLLTISESEVDYALGLKQGLEGAGIRVELDSSDRSLGKKLVLAHEHKPPYIGIIGKKEKDENLITLKNRSGEQETLTLEEARRKLENEIKSKALI